MSVWASSAVWEYSQASGNPFVVLLAIADFADERGQAWASYDRLAARARCSRATVHRSLRQLYDLGELEVVEQGGKRGKAARANVYRVRLEALREPSQIATGHPSQIETLAAPQSLNGETPSVIREVGSTDVAVISSNVSLEIDRSARTREAEAGQANVKSGIEGEGREPPRDLPAEVWAVYVEEMGPRQKSLLPQERQVIQAALKVASVDECIDAIRGCKASAFHMGDNDGGKKYNALSQILRGKSNKRTTREQIDLMRGYLDQASQIPSEASGEISRAKERVRLGMTHPTHDYHRTEGEKAQAFLAGYGITAEAVEYEVAPGVTGLRVVFSGP